MTTAELSKLSPEEKCAKIGELCGLSPSLEWQVMSEDESSSFFSGERHECEKVLSEQKRNFPESQYSKFHVGAWKRYPDYLNSRDAIAEAILSLRPDEANLWARELERIVMFGANPHFVREFHLANATAKERADAFLLAVG